MLLNETLCEVDDKEMAEAMKRMEGKTVHELIEVEPSVPTVQSHQFLVGAAFDDPPLVEQHDHVDDEDDDAYYHSAEADNCERDQEPLLNLVPLLVIAATPSATTTT